jgi:NSS family neurotransmitter:Na+ symporter
MAAAGSAVGLANIWGFPTIAAQNGGAAFLLIYLTITFFVGFPLLMAELTLGRYARSNPVGTYQKLHGGRPFVPMGYLSIIILSFYCIVAGKMLAFFLSALLNILGLDYLAIWIASEGTTQNLIFTSLFFLLTLSIISGGVQNGIEKWSNRFMPALIVIMILLIAFVLTQEGAYEGVKVYLVPDFKKVLNPRLLLDALGQSFFSLSLAVGGMLVFAGYTSKKDNLLRMGALVTFADLGIAFLAGFLIIPAMYVAQANGTRIFDQQGELLSGLNLIFQVLPDLFNSIGVWGPIVASVFFLLMTLAALTSSISILEVPTCYLIDNWKVPRKLAALATSMVSWVVSVAIIFHEDFLFNAIFTLTTKYSQPLLGLALCIFIGWVMNRNTLLTELSSGHPKIANSTFIRLWPYFIRYICPLLIMLIFIQAFIG